jgi:23S rRNA (adenine2030-N6)-methyltransferase
MMREALVRFASGVYAVWYPQVRRRESARLPEQLQRLAGDAWLHVSLTTSAPPADGFGLYGSGMFLFNPPWTLAARMRDAMPALKAALAGDARAAFNLEGKQR